MGYDNKRKISDFRWGCIRERREGSATNSPSNPTFATKLHFVISFVTMIASSSHVFRFDLYFLKKRRKNSLLQLHKQSTSSVQIVNTNDPPKTPVVRRIAESMQSYHTSDFVFEF